MFSNKKWLVLLVLVISVLILSSCQPQVVTVQVTGEAGETIIITATPEALPEEGASEPTFQEEPYRVGVFSDITSTNYWQANGPDNTVWNSYILPQRWSLYDLSDQKFQIVPSLATALPEPLVEEDDMWVTTIPIRNDITWSDGEPFTAEDVAFTANTALRFGLISGNWSQWYDGNFLDHIEAVDDTTVKIFYHTKPGLARNEWGTLQAPILAEHFWAPLVDEAFAPLEGLEKPADDASEDDKSAYNTALADAQDNLYAIAPDGEPLAGSYIFSKWEAGAFVENTYNPEYANTGLHVVEYADGTYEETVGDRNVKIYGEGTGDVDLEYTVGPYFNSAVYTIYGTQDAAILALKAGEVDFVLNSLGLQQGLANQVRNEPNLTVLQNPVNGFRYMTFNTRREPMNDIKFRQAVAVLIDKEYVTKTVLQGVAFPLYTYVPEANEAYYFGDVPKFGLKEDGTPMTREERVNEAVRLLTEAGFKWESGEVPAWNADEGVVTSAGRLLLPSGAPVKDLTLIGPGPGYDPLRATFALHIEGWLNEVGIPVTADLAAFNTVVDKMFTQQDFDMAILGWSLGLFPAFLRDFYHTEQAVVDGNNAGGYSSPEFDELSDQLLTCETYEACKELSDEIQLLLATEMPYVVLFDTGIYEVYNNTTVQYPYTDVLSGLQYVHQTGDPMQSLVAKK